MKSTYYGIPKPCSEDWNKMNATEQGAFCAACSKEVFDCSSLKSAEIKVELATKTEPCIRIFGYQLDELNFLEWFNSLSLRKQLKYAFLFSFILVFNFNVKAQGADDTVFQPQFIQIDPQDSIIFDDRHPLELQTEYELIIYDPPKLELDKTYHLTPLETMGGIMVYGTFIPIEAPPIAVATVLDPSFTLKSERDRLREGAIASNLMLINDIKLTFFIEDDVLIFNSNTLDANAISLKIIKKGGENWIYSDYIHLKAGQREIHFPLEKYDNGIYYIFIENNGIQKVVEVTYW